MNKHRTIIELLQIVKDNIPADTYTGLMTAGFCALLTRLVENKVITFLETVSINRYMSRHGKPKWYRPLQWPRYNYYIKTCYYWRAYDWHVRREWLNKQIKRLTNH